MEPKPFLRPGKLNLKASAIPWPWLIVASSDYWIGEFSTDSKV